MILFGGNLKKYLVFLFTSCVLVTVGKDEFIKKVGNLDVLLLDVNTVLEKKVYLIGWSVIQHTLFIKYIILL